MQLNRIALVTALILAVPLAAQEGSEESLQEAVAQLRLGEWNLARTVAVVTGLQESGQLAAAGWWLHEAERAAADKQLPSRSRRQPPKLRSAWTKATRSPGAKGLAKRLLGHAAALQRLRRHPATHRTSPR